MAATPTRPRYFVWTAVLIVLAGLALRLWELGRASLWYDEVLTELRAQAPLDRFLKMVLESGNQTPLYFALLHLFPTDTEFLLRLPSVILGVIGIALLMAVAVRLYHRYDLALLAGGLLAFNPYHVWLSRTARPYALLFVLSLLASYYFLLLLQGERSRRNWNLFILCSMAVYLTHYFAIALPLAQYVLFAFILRGNRGFFRRWMRAQVVSGLPLAIWLVALMRQEQVAFGIGWIPRPGPLDVPLTFWNMELGYDGALAWYQVIGLIASAVGLVYGLVWAVRGRETNRVDFYWFWLIVAPLVLAFAVSIFRPLYVDRYFMVFLPALILLTAQGWLHLPSLQPRWRVAFAAVVMLIGAVSVVITLDRGDDQKEDWRGAARYIEQDRQPGDGLLVESPVNLVIFHRYFDIDSIPRGWLEGDPDLADQFGAPVQRVWALYRNPREDGHVQGVLPDFNPFKPGSSPMPGWLIPRRDQVVAQQEFNGVTVLLVDVSSGLGAED